LKSTLLAGTLALAVSSAAQAPSVVRIGAAGAVAGKVEALSAYAGAIGRIVQSGQPLYLNDKITTGPQGRLQVLLQDETVFTIGPNSAMVLDEFVYNPSSGSGKLSARILKGVFRFVSGAIARKQPEDMSIKTPVGVIGIRGTIGGGDVGDDSVLIVLFGPKEGNNAGNRTGQLKLTSNNGNSVYILQPGYGAKMDANSVSKAFKISKSQLEALLNQLQGGNPGNGDPSGVKGFDAGQQSGQDTGKGLDNLNDVKDVNLSSNDAQTLLATLNQNVLLDGPSTWEQLRTFETGIVSYGGTGVFTQNLCSFAACSVQGTSQIYLELDFGARMINGGQIAANAGTINVIGSFGSTPFGASGTAAFQPSMSSSFNGTSITILNQGGVIGGAASSNVQYNDGFGNAGSGSVTGTRGGGGPLIGS